MTTIAERAEQIVIALACRDLLRLGPGLQEVHDRTVSLVQSAISEHEKAVRADIGKLVQIWEVWSGTGLTPAQISIVNKCRSDLAAKLNESAAEVCGHCGGTGKQLQPHGGHATEINCAWCNPNSVSPIGGDTK